MNPVQIGDATLYLGDCLEILPTLDKVDAVVTDPPYGVDFIGKRFKEKPNATGGYIGGDSNIGPVAVSIAIERSSRGVVFPGARLMFDYPKPYDIGSVFCKAGTGFGRWGFLSSHPVLFYGKATKHGRQTSNTLDWNNPAECTEKRHPCPKPTSWMLWAVDKCTTDVGEIILDPFMGSGTTGVACANLGRKFIGIEIEPKYFDIACERIEAAYAQGRLFE